MLQISLDEAMSLPALHELYTRRVDQLVRPFETWSHAALAIPTDDCYRPMVAALGLLLPGEDLTFFNEAIDMGSLSMRSFITA